MNVDITSTTNPKIKWLKSLHTNSTRRKEGVFLVEGSKEIAMALDGNYQPHSIFICPEIAGDISSDVQHEHVFSISKDCYEKVSYRSGSDGVLAVFHADAKIVDDLSFADTPFFIVVEAIEKPGNLGAIIRTADGCGASGVIVCDPKTDVFNPNVIRASVGTLFTTQVAVDTTENVIDFFAKHEIQAYGALLSPDSIPYTEANLSLPAAIVLGTEHDGLSALWQKNSQPIQIPMLGQNDSLNVSVAAAVLSYEALRQRNIVDSE